MSEGPTCVEVQRDSTPLVGMAYLEAFEATADSYYLEAAREVARALVKGQYCSGGWDYFIEFEPQSVRSTRTALTGVVASADPSAQSGRQRWMTTSRRPACVS